MNSYLNSKTPSSTGHSPNKKEDTVPLNGNGTKGSINSRWKLEYKRDNLHQTTISNSKTSFCKIKSHPLQSVKKLSRNMPILASFAIVYHVALIQSKLLLFLFGKTNFNYLTFRCKSI